MSRRLNFAVLKMKENFYNCESTYNIKWKDMHDLVPILRWLETYENDVFKSISIKIYEQFENKWTFTVKNSWCWSIFNSTNFHDIYKGIQSEYSVQLKDLILEMESSALVENMN